MSELIPISLLTNIPNLYETDNIKDPICKIKLFTPDSNWTWYIIEISQENNDTCYGLVKGLENELGYFSLEEVSKIRGSLGLSVERDTSFNSMPLSKIRNIDNG